MTAPVRDDEPLERHLAPVYDEPRAAATWSRIAARRWPAARARRPWAFAGAAIAVIAVAAAIVAWPAAPRSAPLASRDTAISVAPGTVWTSLQHDLVLDDDSSIALAGDARLQILANEGTRFATLLQAGSAHFDVHPGGPRRWEIETALASVEVVGTAFTVSLRDGALEVGVERGVVLVHGERVPGRVVRLTAGQRLTVAPATPTIAEVPAALPAAVAPLAPSAPVRVPPPPPRVVAAPPVRVESVADAIARADELTSAGDPAAAAALLERVRGRDSSSGLVAFTLGRLYLDALGKPALAAAAFEDVIASGSPRGLLEDAYARRAEAWVRAGEHDRAATALAAYEHAYPRGRRLAALRALVGAP